MKRTQAHMFHRMAKGWMLLRECMVPAADRRREREEEVLANLYNCLEELQSRTQAMEGKVAQWGEQAMGHMRCSNHAPSAAVRQREKQKAKQCMEERRRVQAQLDKATLMRGTIQTHIDSIMSTHMDMLIVDAMRGFNYAASNLSLPERTEEVCALGGELSERQSEVVAMQDAIMGIGASMAAISPSQTYAPDTSAEDEELWAELNALMRSDDDEQPASARRRPSSMPAHDKQHAEALRKLTVAKRPDDTNDAEKILERLLTDAERPSEKKNEDGAAGVVAE